MNDAHLLLVEDDESLAGLLSAHLRAHGYRVTVAPTAEIAESLLAGGTPPDLILLDINLPGDTGWSLVRDPLLQAAGAPPVVVATATTINPRRLREFGISGYLPKPFALETLVSTIDRLLHSKEAPTPDV